MFNPGTEAANVQVTYITTEGQVNSPSIGLGPGARYTLNVADMVPDTWSVSTEITSDKPVAAERYMYWNNRIGGHCTVGSREFR